MVTECISDFAVDGQRNKQINAIAIVLKELCVDCAQQLLTILRSLKNN